MDDLEKFQAFFLGADTKGKEAVLGQAANFRGLLKTQGEFSFISTGNLIQLYVYLFYKNSTIIVILNPQVAMEYIPKIMMLKRDNLDAYLKCKKCNFIILEFNSIPAVDNWAYSFPSNKIEYEIYSNAKLIKTNEGDV